MAATLQEVSKFTGNLFTSMMPHIRRVHQQVSQGRIDSALSYAETQQATALDDYRAFNHKFQTFKNIAQAIVQEVATDPAVKQELCTLFADLAGASGVVPAPASSAPAVPVASGV